MAPEQRLPFVRFMSDQVEDYRNGFDRVKGWRLNQTDGLPDVGNVRWLLAYPTAYRGLVERLAADHGLSDAFMYAIMRVESHYAPAAVSQADAVGALQMIPPTAQKCAAEMGLSYDSTTFADPRVGFPYSFFYMAKQARLWKGQLLLAAASYNAGPRPMARWLEQNKGAPLAFLVEEIAYREARGYIRLVATHTLRYLYMYETDPTARAKWLDALFPVDVDYEVPEDIGY